MLVQDEYIEVKIQFPAGVDFVEIIDQMALENNCEGIVEIDCPEEELDELLKENGLFATNPSEEELSLIEEHFKSKNSARQYFFYGENKNDFVDNFISYLEDFDNLHIELRVKKVEDWNERWREHYDEIDVEKNFKIIPSWHEKNFELSSDYNCNNNNNNNYNNNSNYNNNHKMSQTIVKIYPGQGFGSGEHPTTFLCLKAIFELIASGSENHIKNVLDFGCGSGILGISSLLLGASFANFYDVDGDAILNTQTNLEINKVQIDKFFISTSTSTIKLESFDLVVANIISSVLIHEARTINSKVNCSGFLILSGILEEQVLEVFNSYITFGYKLIKQTTKDNWVCLVLEKIA